MAKRKLGFTSSVGFILAAAGSAVGLGNLWGFPYKTAMNGGAAFVLIYIACVLFIGCVTMLSEIFIGRRAHANPITAFKSVNKNIGWFGLLSICIPFLITCYYSVLGGYTVKYSLNSFVGNEGILGTFSTNVGDVILCTAIFIVITLLIIMAGVKDGIEKMSKVLMPVLLIILVVMVVYSLCLGEGVSEGLSFYLKPDFSSVTFTTVLSAMGQAFFSLSLGMGAMITYGAYTGRETNLVTATGLVCLCDTAVALLGGLAIFPAIAHFDPSLLNGSRGIGLIFSILPSVFNSMGVIGQILSFLFFAMVTIAALTSVISLVEVVTQFSIQKFKLQRKKAVTIVTAICFVISIPIGISLGKVGICEEPGLNLFGLDLLTFLDEVTNTVLMPVCAFFSCITIGWFFGADATVQGLEERGCKMGWLGGVYKVMVRYITPILILVVEVGGIIDKIKAKQYSVVIFSYVLLLVCVAVYFVFLRNTDTGTNKDEVMTEVVEIHD